MARCDYIEEIDKINQGRHFTTSTTGWLGSSSRAPGVSGNFLHRRFKVQFCWYHWSLLHAVPHFSVQKGEEIVFFVLPKNRCLKLCEKVLQISKCQIFSESAVPSRSRRPSNKVVQKWPICPPRNWERWAELFIRIFLLFNNLTLLFYFVQVSS